MGFDLRRALGSVLGSEGGRLLVLTHDNPDPDALAAALGLGLIAEQAGWSVTLAAGGYIGRAENRAMVRELAIPLTQLDQLDPSEFQRIALLDTQPKTGNNSLPVDRLADIVIDHHPARPESLASPWCDIRDSAGATSTIVYGYLKELGIVPDKRVATAFLYALKSETRDLVREAGPLERQAYVELIAGADHQKLYAIANPKVGREHFVAVDRALRAALVRGELMTANLGALDYPDLVAEVADLLLPLERVHWVLCIGQHEGTVYLSIRSDLTDAKAGDLIRRVIAQRGAGGGHGMVAGGRLFARVNGGAELATVADDLVSRLANELKIAAPPMPLL
jgi:nanoRNase/pAp phosphatase (c-di-AMP/oligoRNAs hydrolase)